jgi:hypothetical protein
MAHEAMDVGFGDGDEASDNITFEYIEPRQGFVCEILHTGSASDFEFSGTLIGAREPVLKELPPPKTSMTLALTVIVLGIVVMFILVKTFGNAIRPDEGLTSYILGKVLMVTIGLTCTYSCFNILKGAFPKAYFGSRRNDSPI